VVASLKRLRIEATVSLPGALIGRDGRYEPGFDTARMVVISGVELEDDFKRLERQLDEGKITEAELVAAIQVRLVRTMTFCCRAGDEPAEAEQKFQNDLGGAKAAYAGSDLMREVSEARKALRPTRPEIR
jgi:hypothetical protein